MDMNSYFRRIKWNGPVAPDFATLMALHQRHAMSIPFENLDIQLGRPISLDLESLERKMIQNDRGGYCFEQNTLFQAVLQEIGFNVIACEARVRMGRPVVTPRSHMLLIVQLHEERYLADVGFGGDGLLQPVPLNSQEKTQFHWKYRVVKEREALILQTFRNENWFDLYAFLPQKREPVDFEVANWYTSTHPQSRFVQTLTAQLPTPYARYILRNKTFSVEKGGEMESRELQNREELLALLSEKFGLSFPADTVFHNPHF
jgi:N-hydroxyarylamine O-acetyltransferase